MSDTSDDILNQFDDACIRDLSKIARFPANSDLEPFAKGIREAVRIYLRDAGHSFSQPSPRRNCRTLPSGGSTEAALGHIIGDRAEQAYRRDDALERRRQLMQHWANYCKDKSVEIIPLRNAS